MATQVIHGDEARTRVLKGAEQLYDAVRVTYGPKGRNVVIANPSGGITVTHDGVTVAESVDLPDNDEATLGYKVGADLIKQAAAKLNKVAGDGTTTVTVLTYNILKEANRLIAAGHNPMELRKGIEAASAEVLAQLDKLSENIEGNTERVAEVATISAGDAHIGKLIASVIEKIGKDGVVTVEASNGLDLEADVVEGFDLDRGWSSPYFVTDQSRQEAVYENPAIIVTDKKISSVADLLPLVEKLATANRKDVVIFADEVESEALSILIMNKLKGVLNTVVVKAPSFGDQRKQILEDIAVLTGGILLGDELSITEAPITAIGSARKVIVTQATTTIIEGRGGSLDPRVEMRIESIKAQAANASSEYVKEQYEKRAAALGGKVAVIKVGGVTETEIEEKKFRVDDAVAATKAALADGIVAGGGITLLNLAKTLDANSTDSIGAGRMVLKQALRVPFALITSNAGLNSEALLAQVDAAKPGMGVDVNNPDAGLIDVKKAGVIDPARVTKEAIQNAVSIASTAATMGALVVNVPTQPV